jgi:hypothetical protein
VFKNHQQPRVGPLPLIVGVTGHRDLSPGSIGPARDKVREVLVTVRDAHPHTNVHVMTALADGADQLVAELTLELGMHLIAALPMPLEEYAATMSNDEARRTFESLLAQATLTVTMPPVPSPTSDGEAPPLKSYELLGLFLARTSHILLALWDGKPHLGEATRGGSAHVVAMRATPSVATSIAAYSPLHPSGLDELDLTDPGPTLRIGVARAGDPWTETVGQIFDANETATVALPDLSEAAKVEGLARLDEANRRLASRKQSTTARRVEDLANTLVPASTLRDEPEDRRKALDVVRRARAMAAMETARNQKSIYRVHLGMVAALPLAVLLFEIYSHLSKDIVALSLYLATVAGVFAFHYLVSARREWQSWYQDFRALAEALRVQVFWGLACIPDAVAESYLKKHRADLAWIGQAVRGLSPWGLAAAVSGPPRIDAVTDLWVRKQLAFFAGADGQGGAAERERQRARRADIGTTIAYLIGLGVGGVLLCLHLILGQDVKHILHVAVIPMGLAPAVAGAFSIYAEKRAFTDHAHQYRRMGAVFQRGLGILRSARGQDETRAQWVLRDLGREALGENGDWLLAHRDRPIEPIKGG